MMLCRVMRDVAMLREDMYRDGGPIHSAYNRILGDDVCRRGRTNDKVVGYFNEDGEMFAWSYFLDDVKDIGRAVDHWGFYSHWSVLGEPRGTQVQELRYMLRIPAAEGDI